MQANQTIGKVIFAGAGPGDVDLITVKLLKTIPLAEVIIVDRLVNPLIIEQYKSPTAEVIFLGKQGYNCLSTAQTYINETLVEYALQGKTILRLKGGDVAFYSNIMDELLTLHLRNIPFEIIPGITAASGASAYAGIPLTARGYARSVRFLLYKNENCFTQEEWKNLATTTETLVLYMGINKLADFVLTLKKQGSPTNKELAIVEQATTVFQKVHIFSFEEDWANKDLSFVETPALVIVGAVASLHNHFQWFKPKAHNGSIFNPLHPVEKNVSTR